ncbi:MAG: hypothetical protein ACYC6M_14320 [Terriglobales bacterium]
MPKLLRALLALLVLAVLGYLVYSSTHAAQFRVEVCVNYQGRTACRIAAARTREEALRGAHDNACADVASGVTESVGCNSTPPASVRWITSDPTVP